MGTIADKLNYLTETKNQLNQSLENKGLTPTDDFRNSVEIVNAYTNDATAVANDIISPKTAYVNGIKITGEIVPTYSRLDTIVETNINISNLKILDYSEKLNVVIYTINPNTSLYLSKIVDGEIDVNNQIIIPTTTLGISETVIKEAKIQTNPNNNGSYTICILAGSYTILVDIDINSLNIIGVPIPIVDTGILIYPNPVYKNFMITNCSLGSSRDIFTSYISIVDCETKTKIYSGTYQTSGVSGATGVSLYNVTGTWSNDGLYFLYNQGGFNRYSAVNAVAAASKLMKFNENFTYKADIKSLGNLVGCFIGTNKILIGNILYEYNDTVVTEIGILAGMQAISIINRSYGINGNCMFSIGNTIYWFNRSSGSSTNFRIYSFNENDNTCTVSSSAVYSIDPVKSFHNLNLVITQNNLIMASYMSPITDIITKLRRLDFVYVNTVDSTALNSDILSSKTAYSQNNKIEGTMPNNGATNITPTMSSQIIPEGYTTGGTVEGIKDTSEYEAWLDTARGITSDIVMHPYTPIEYIQSTGTQYINTGIPSKNTITVKVKYSIQKVGEVLVGYQTSELKALRFMIPNTQFYLDYGSGEGRNRIFGGTCVLNTIYNTEFGNRYIKNLETGTNIVSGSTVGSFTYSDGQIGLFANGNGGKLGLKGKIYYCKIYDGDILVRDFIPVIYEGVTGLWDKANSTFYPNQGSGTFTAGPIIQEETTLNENLDAILLDKEINCLAGNIKAGVSILGINGTAPVTFATITEMNEHTDLPEDTYAIVYGTSYVGTYRLDNSTWTQIGDSTEEQEIMDDLNAVLGETGQYEGNGGTDEEINNVLVDILEGSGE